MVGEDAPEATQTRERPGVSGVQTAPGRVDRLVSIPERRTATHQEAAEHGQNGTGVRRTEINRRPDQCCNHEILYHFFTCHCNNRANNVRFSNTYLSAAVRQLAFRLM